jgi:hypothetical protein
VDPRAGLDDVEKRKFLTLPLLELQRIKYSTLQKARSHKKNIFLNRNF